MYNTNRKHNLLNEITEIRTGCGFREKVIQDVIIKAKGEMH